MASVQLTDEELFSELKRFGFTPGPVTENTRPVYLKKLKKLREEQQQRSRGVKGRNGSSVNSSSTGASGGGNNGHTAAGASAFRARPTASDVTHVNTTRSPGARPLLNEKRAGRAGKLLLGFSSDESDAEAPQKKGGPNHSGGGGRRDRGSALHPIRPTQETPTAGARRSPALGFFSSSSGKSYIGLSGSRRSALGSPWWTNRGKASFGAEDKDDCDPEDTDNLEEERERNGRTLNGSKGSHSSKLSGDYSDTDEDDDEEEEEGERERRRERRLLSRRTVSKFISSTPYKSVWESERIREKVPEPESGAARLDMASELGEDDGETSELTGSYRKSPPFTSVNGEESSSSSSSKPGGEAAAGSGSFTSGLRPRFSPYNSLDSTYTFNHSNHTGSNHNYSPKRKASGPEDELLEQFKRDEVSATGGFSAHYLSMFLLIAACLFFVLLGLMYLRMRGSGASDAVAGKYTWNTGFQKYLEQGFLT